MSNTVHTSTTSGKSVNLNWSVVDILICSVLGVASGLFFWLYNGPGGASYDFFDAVTPGLGGLITGPWFIAAIIGGFAIRKPGAALYCEVVAACVSASLGNQWGIQVIYSGLAQGLGAEIILAIFVYRRFGLLVAALAGAGSGVGAFILELFIAGNAAKGFGFNVVYLSTLMISGAVLAGIVGFFVVRILAQTGALDRVAGGRAHQKLV